MTTKAEVKERWQSVIITLDDGRVGVFTGRVLVDTDDEHQRRVADIKFAAPRPLPDGCSFDLLENLK